MRLALGVLLGAAGCLSVMAAAQEPDAAVPPTSEQPGIPQVQQSPAEQHDQGGAASDAQADHGPERETAPVFRPVEAEGQQESANGLREAQGNQDGVRDVGLPPLPTAPDWRLPEAWEPFFNGLKFTDAITASAAAFAVVVAYLQLRILRQHSAIMARTRDIAVAALGRPYVFVEFISHNMEEWRAGRDRLRFDFRFTNHGAAPAVIEFIHAKAMLSYGPYSRHEDVGDLVKHGYVRPFPPKEGLLRHISWNAQVGYASDEPGGQAEGWEKGSPLVIKAGETSRTFQATLPLPALKTAKSQIGWQVTRRLREATDASGSVSPWLIGSITYQSPFGAQHWTNFCLRARSDGTAAGYDEHPYAERT